MGIARSILLALALTGCSRLPWTSAHAIARGEAATAAILSVPASGRFRNVTVDASSGVSVVCGEVAGLRPNGHYSPPARFLTLSDGEAAMIDTAAGDAVKNPANVAAAAAFESQWQSDCQTNPANIYQPDALANDVDPDVGPSGNDIRAAAEAVDRPDAADRQNR